MRGITQKTQWTGKESEREKELEGGGKGRRREKILYEGQRDERGGSWCVCVSVCLGLGWGVGLIQK